MKTPGAGSKTATAQHAHPLCGQPKPCEPPQQAPIPRTELDLGVEAAIIVCDAMTAFALNTDLEASL
jgi:hypothetical protein